MERENNSECSHVFKSLTKHLKKDIKEERGNIKKEKHRIKEDKDSLAVMRLFKKS